MEYYKNLSLEDLFYINDDGLVCCEEWRDVKGYEGKYVISDLGRIKALDRYVKYKGTDNYFLRKGRIMKSRVRKSGYVTATLHKDKNNLRKELFNHKLVLIAFKENPENKKEGNHKKGIKTDNRLSELEWCTRAENNRHAIDTGLLVARKGSEVYNAVFNEEKVALIRRFYRMNPKTKQRDFAKRMGICYKQLNGILRGNIWKHVVI